MRQRTQASSAPSSALLLPAMQHSATTIRRPVRGSRVSAKPTTHLHLARRPKQLQWYIEAACVRLDGTSFEPCNRARCQCAIVDVRLEGRGAVAMLRRACHHTLIVEMQIGRFLDGSCDKVTGHETPAMNSCTCSQQHDRARGPQRTRGSASRRACSGKRVFC